MALTTTGTISSGLSWNAVDTEQSTARVTDIGSVTADFDFTAGSGTGTVSAVYHQQTSLPSGQSVQFDLHSLSRQIFGSTLVSNFSGGYIQDFILTNNSPTGSIYLRATGSNAFTNMFNGGSGNIEIGPLDSYHHSKRLNGWAVDGTQRYFQLTDAGTGCLYSLAFIGRTGAV